METNLSNKVVARLNNGESTVPRRSLDLGNIITPELGLLSPNRNEIAPRGKSREAALIAYSERLRNSYKQNDFGLKDGMVMLGEAFRSGQSISITCFCRGGQTCHADVVKLAIEKVAKAIDARGFNRAADHSAPQKSNFQPSNPRTERAINEILSVSSSDLVLSRIDDTDGRNRSEHASYLNGTSQFLRETYERGGTVQNGVLIIPKELHDLKSPLQLATLSYGVNRLEPLIGSARARELAPEILKYGKTIAGSNSDRETESRVFRWIYDSLEGKHELLDESRVETKSESTAERFDRTLTEIKNVADEMEKLEPSERSIQYEQFVDLTVEDTDRSLREEVEGITESAEYLLREEDPEHNQTNLGFERIELENEHLTFLASEMSADEMKHWSEVKFPALDEALENGIPPSTILKLFRAKSDQSIENGVKGKELNYEDLRLASAYLEYQLKQPETRLRHFNERYRDYSERLDRCQSREEVIDVSSRIRIENASSGMNREQNGQGQDSKSRSPLTSKELQMLFTEQSPRHYSSEMIVAKLNYAGDGASRDAKTEALLKGELMPSPEARKLVDSLETRMGRKYVDESLSATKHFLQSLRTPNQDLRYKNTFDHSELYRKLHPAERDFVYQLANHQKEQLENSIRMSEQRNGSIGIEEQASGQPQLEVEKLRQTMKSELLALSISNADREAVTERTSSILTDHLESVGLSSTDREATRLIAKDLSEVMLNSRGPLRTSISKYDPKTQASEQAYAR